MIQMDAKVVSRIDEFPSRDVIDELKQKIPDFSRAYDQDGLSIEE